MRYIYRDIRAAYGCFTVGTYDCGQWEPESDHPSAESAAARVHYLNGGSNPSHPLIEKMQTLPKEDLDFFLELCKQRAKEIKNGENLGTASPYYTAISAETSICGTCDACEEYLDKQDGDIGDIDYFNEKALSECDDPRVETRVISMSLTRASMENVIKNKRHHFANRAYVYGNYPHYTGETKRILDLLTSIGNLEIRDQHG